MKLILPADVSADKEKAYIENCEKTTGGSRGNGTERDATSTSVHLMKPFVWQTPSMQSR
ncbi:hypothetical protein [Sulfurovum sp.]|uniref:hypothetical protein n=1 Tax=Sulfurovum sp. TaxID=1969726 RepID=UPI0025CB8E8C|nr:hypothetical protein [Sulfurovum sp.]